ncbi:MAG: mRNA surveillance protein pelota [Nanoarchaeota archaeon]|nr:mRNA surveillance protein pelota [Nanoarchaeota archaeon]
MKIIHKDLRKGEIKVMIENLDDLWYLSTVIDNSDIIKGKTFRKIKIGEGDQRKSEVVKKQVFLSINAEKIEFNEQALRVSGTVQEGTEEIPKGSHHTFNLEDGTIITIIKERWLKFQLDKIREASEDKGGAIMIVVLDREEADFALMKKYGFEIINSIKGNVKKKRIEEKDNTNEKNFYETIFDLMKEQKYRYKISKIVLGSPGFWKDEFMKVMKDDDLKKDLILATCSTTGTNGINEVIRRPEVKQALQEQRAAKEINLVEEVLSEISKNGAVAYGLKEVKTAADAGAIKILMITDTLIHKAREEINYAPIEKMMRNIDAMNGDIVIVSGENDGGRKLNGLGGIAALLRYKMSY